MAASIQLDDHNKGYYRYPTVFGDQVVFVSEDDLWTVQLSGGTARRLTAGLGTCSHPSLSPDGRWIAFSSAEEGHQEVYIIPAQGGSIRRLTYLASISIVVGWLTNEQILFKTDALDNLQMMGLCTVSVNGDLPKRLSLGPASSMSVHDESGVVILERNSRRSEPAHWKRYRGGTAGKFYRADSIDGEFVPFLREIKGNLSRPFWFAGGVLFLSDHEGVGNLYSCSASGGDVRRLTSFRDFYVRNPASDGKVVVFHAGADLYRFDPTNGKCEKIDIFYASQLVQRQRKFVDPKLYLEDYSPSRDGRSVCITTRGQVVAMNAWNGPVVFAGKKEGVRYRMGRWIEDDKRILQVSDEGGEERLEIFNIETRESNVVTTKPFGRVTVLKVSPDGKKAALINHRHEVLIFDLEKTDSCRRISRAEHHWHQLNCNWSPDGRYLAYTKNISSSSSPIHIYDTQLETDHQVTRPFFGDFMPVFDPEGRYLYFLSERELNPVYDSAVFDLGFSKTCTVCLVTLQKELRSPLLPSLATEDRGQRKNMVSEKTGNLNEKLTPIKIDFEGICDRLVRLPIESERYFALNASKGKVFVAYEPVEGALGAQWQSETLSAKGTMRVFDLAKLKAETFVSNIRDFKISSDGSRLLIRSGNNLRVRKCDEKVQKQDDREVEDDFNEENGRVNLSRIKVYIEPAAEWRQMFHETWRLQRDHFWREDMSKIDWKSAYETYLPLIERINTRSEFGDLVWELQGELGTSHAYEFGGDYRPEPKYLVGLLGARFEWDAEALAYRIDRVWRGDSWQMSEASPLRTPGVMAEEGDWLTAIQHHKLTETFTPYEALLNLASQEVEITLRRKDGGKDETHRVMTLKNEASARYRDWTERNREYVHNKTNGRVGYVHIPNMGARGFSEFHRHYLQDFDCDALLIDVRFNGGGHVSQLLLEKLARKRIGYDLPRWLKPEAYPIHSPAGPMVALTNEFAGSDGDIFSHSFKLMKLGSLLGTRTWGGVVGIGPRHRLVDRGMTTQPEYSFWFSDVGWKLENYGTDPDIVVEDLPHHYRRGEDQQMDRAIAELMRKLEENPPQRFNVTEFPDLSINPSF